MMSPPPLQASCDAHVSAISQSVSQSGQSRSLPGLSASLTRSNLPPCRGAISPFCLPAADPLLGHPNRPPPLPPLPSPPCLSHEERAGQAAKAPIYVWSAWLLSLASRTCLIAHLIMMILMPRAITPCLAVMPWHHLEQQGPRLLAAAAAGVVGVVGVVAGPCSRAALRTGRASATAIASKQAPPPCVIQPVSQSESE